MSRAARVVALCRELAAFTETPGRTTRTFLSPPMREVHARLGDRMAASGMSVRVDAAGNLRGLLPAATPNAPRVLIGSHLDTVPDAGAFDGVLGVVLGVALVEALAGDRLAVAVEVVGFSEEEGVRFGAPFIGSRAVVGALAGDLRARRDARGLTVDDAIVAYGLDPEDLDDARLDAGATAFLEFHIEQGPELEARDEPLGLVDAIVGQSRLGVGFRGAANHAGTTPMHGRRDALAAAAEWIVAVERDAREAEGLVATVGEITALPGAANVIPGGASLSLDVRHRDDGVRRAAVVRLVASATAIAARRGVEAETVLRSAQDAVRMDGALLDALDAAAARTGRRVPRLTSGAGHDAMILAPHLPTAMLFLRSPGGLSHHPDEAVRTEDVAAALEVGEAWLRGLA